MGARIAGLHVALYLIHLEMYREKSSCTIINPTGIWGPYASSPIVKALPVSNVSGSVTLVFPEGQTQLKTLTTSDIVGSNLSGTFVIENGFTWGSVTFYELEPDGNFDVWVQFKSYTGSAPAVGSAIPGRITINSDGSGFFMDVDVDPGGSCVITFSYLIVRNTGGPFYSESPVSIPSTLANPLVPKYTNFTPWCIGFTIKPASGDVFTYSSAQPIETMLNLGTTLGDSHWAELYFNGHSSEIISNVTGVAGSLLPVSLSVDSFVVDPSNKRNRLINLYNPGSHNIVINQASPSVTYFWIDGALAGISILTNWTGFLSDIYRGEKFDTTQQMTRATMTNFKIDALASKCITIEQTTGPGRQIQSMFFGDEWTLGSGAASSAGGYASQIAQAKYGTYYYWFAAVARRFLGPGRGYEGLLVDVWQPWGQYQNLDSAVVLTGWHDLLQDLGGPPTTGDSAAVVWSELLKILEGAQASQTFTPPTSNSFAIALFATNLTSWGACAGIINGVTVNCPFTSNESTSFTNFANDINSNGSLNTLVSAAYVPVSGGNGYVAITALAPGTSGDGIPVSATGAGFWYTGFPSANATFGGRDCILTVNNVSFNANFDTDANTSTNNLVSLITASIDPSISGVVTASNIGSKCVITAVAYGIDANDIILTINGVQNGSYLGSSPTDVTGGTMIGGLNGLLNRVSNIILCTVPPFGITSSYYTTGKEAERQTFNTNIRNWVTANAGAGAILADVDATVKDGLGTSLDPTYDDGGGYLNDTGQTAVYGLIFPLLP